MFSIASFSACHFAFMPDERSPFDLQLNDAALHLVDLQRHRVDLDAQHRGRLVDQVDGFVGQEAVGYVAVRQSSCRDDSAVGDANAVVDLVTLLQAAQDTDRVLDAGLGGEDRLESTLEGRVGFDMLAILVQRRCANDTQLAASEEWLEHVAGIDRALGGARTDYGVQFVDEDDVLALGLGDLLQQGLEPFLELAPVLRSGHHGGNVDLDDLLVAQRLRHITIHHALRQTLDDRRLADTRLADQYRVVLCAPRQHLNDATDLLVTPDYRVQLAPARHIREIRRVLLDRLVLLLRIAVGHPVRAPHRLDRLPQVVMIRAQALEQRPRRARLSRRQTE
jgi:hypothetical protein